MGKDRTLEAIRSEIERRWKDYRNSVTPDQPKYRTHYFVGKGEVCEELLSFLDTLEEERPEPYNPVYDEAYLNEKIKKATESWKGVDVDAMLAECRGYDEEKSEKQMQEELEEELEKFIESGESVTVDNYGTYQVSYHDFKKIARHFAEWGKEQGYREGFLEGAKIQREEDNQLVDIIYQQGIEKGKDEIRETLKKEEENERNTTSGI